jgi:hypothetical protein
MGRGGSGARTALIVPGAAVRRYVSGAVDALHAVGISAELLVAPGEPRVPADLVEYGRALAGRIVSSGGVDALIGLSVGAQAAAVAAAVATESPPHSPPTGPPNEPLSVTSPRYRHVDVLLFQHGVSSEGIVGSAGNRAFDRARLQLAYGRWLPRLIGVTAQSSGGSRPDPPRRVGVRRV